MASKSCITPIKISIVSALSALLISGHAQSAGFALQENSGSGLGSAYAGSLNLVSNLYLTYPVDPRWSIGLGVNAPFGLVTEYENGWIG